ncbi:MAG: hypothetical protein FJX57_14140 [Alphaproteobacteria bacterium]|nr:hypothetical protein [Alphaproteobacteria bacterium]
MLASDGTRVVAVFEDELIAWSMPAGVDALRLPHTPPIDWDAMRRRDVDERRGALRVVLGHHAILRQTGSVEIAATSPDATRVLTTRIDEIARLWDASAGRLIVEVAAGTRSEASFSGDGARVAFTTADGVQILDAPTGRTLARLPIEGAVRRVLLDHDGGRLAVLHDDVASLVAVDGARRIGRLEGAKDVQRAPDARSFAFRGANTLHWIDAASGKMLAEVTCQCRVATAVFGAGGRVLAVVTDDNEIRVRSREASNASRDLKHSGLIADVVFSPDGQMLSLTGSEPRTVETKSTAGQPRVVDKGEPWQRLVEIKTEREIALEQERVDPAQPVFSADGRFLAVDTVVWDAATGRRVARADAPVVAFSPDGRLLLTRRDGVIQIQPWRDEDLLALACRQLPRNMSTDDWHRHVSRDEPLVKTCAQGR